ncbi:hypothetical protein EW146_g5556 [Bondarzewia mesenterica]|uniref:Uncharacterized protein n=1 Tax=Bondarzewia mesenterica TaxID=1095465 RepID=A0A4V3XES9_9AGAM|nr:hypothetical protein EW146_g5556 [Bondarzewia mesenterica]
MASYITSSGSDPAAGMSDPMSPSSRYTNSFTLPVEEEDTASIDEGSHTSFHTSRCRASAVSEHPYFIQQAQRQHETESEPASPSRTLPYGGSSSDTIVLSWKPPQASHDSNTSFNKTSMQRALLRQLVMAASVEPLTYVFTPLLNNSMLLIPPPIALDSSARYHISIHLDCFSPTSYSTVVRRGASETGQYVGEFNSNEPDMITIGTETMRIDEALTATSKKGIASLLTCHRRTNKSFKRETWRWSFGHVNLFWSCCLNVYECTLPAGADGRFGSPVKLATFTRKSTAIVGRSVHQCLATLQVYQQGNTFF